MSQFAYAAGSDDSGSDNNKADFYNEAKKLVQEFNISSSNFNSRAFCFINFKN